jgi:tRNA(fMet)-specific endonuclease VapC
MDSPRYLLDTNALSEVVKQPAGVVARRIAAAGEDNICTSIVVACELRYGAAKKDSPVLNTRIEQLLSDVEVLPLAEGVDRRYADLRTQLEQAGQPISAHDMLIAAHALTLGLTVVTANVREFRRVPGLAVENWLEQSSG